MQRWTFNLFFLLTGVSLCGPALAAEAQKTGSDYRVLLSKPAAFNSKQLEEQGRRFLGDRQKGLTLDRGKKKLSLSQVFKWRLNELKTINP
jgi:hypothetical protein